MATGPYRRPPARPPSCDRHTEAPATDRCGRCTARLCDDCLAFAGAGICCAGCARTVRRRGAVVRVLALVVVPMVIELPGLLIDWTPRPLPTLKEIVLKEAIRSCSTPRLDLFLSSLLMHGNDGEVVAMGDAYAAECKMGAVTEGMVSGARERLREGR